MRRIMLLVALLVTGCAFDPKTGIEPPPPPPPAPDSPQNLMLAFERVYEQQTLPGYEGLLTSDFRYTFSRDADPELANLYPNWGRDDEVESTKHLFEGFTNNLGKQIPAATRIDMTLTGVQYGDDFTHSDSLEWYQRVVVTAVDMTIEVPGSPEPTIYRINARHEFYLVRGDAAVLDAGQEARTDRWYLRRWDDLSPPPPAAIDPMTWGALKVAGRATEDKVGFQGR